VNFAFSEEQDEFRAMVARFVAEQWPVAEVRRLMDRGSGFDPSVWKQMAAELGLLGLALPGRYGGQDCTALELCIAMEEFGRALAGGPYFATAVLAAPAILALGSDAQKQRWLPQIAAGELIATLALPQRGAGLEAERDGTRLSGQVPLVLAAQSAGLLLFAVQRQGEEILMAVQSDDPGVAISAQEELDPTRKFAAVSLRDAAAEPLGEPSQTAAALTSVRDHAAIALAAEMLGGASRCLELAVTHAQERIQFARPIGSFQAVKHRAAEVLLELETARPAVEWASWVGSQETSAEELAEAASVALSLASDAYLRASADCIHLHGGMGFTWEADPHLYYRRARTSATLLGDATAQRARLARHLGLAATEESCTST
jgi:alkylation response protein AidB-like acyl-CoA dehydrogenase